MTKTTTNKTAHQNDIAYDYACKCDCSEDDNCGCSFPNNLSHDHDTGCIRNQQGECISPSSISHKKVEIETPATHLSQETICICSPKECDCATSTNVKKK